MFLNHLYGGTNKPDAKIIDVFVCKLRKKLTSASGGEDYIATVRGRGYTLREWNGRLSATEAATRSLKPKTRSLTKARTAARPFDQSQTR